MLSAYKMSPPSRSPKALKQVSVCKSFGLGSQVPDRSDHDDEI